MGGTGHYDSRGIQAGYPLQGIRLNGSAGTEDDLARLAPDTGLVAQLMHLGRRGMLGKHHQA